MAEDAVRAGAGAGDHAVLCEAEVRGPEESRDRKALLLAHDGRHRGQQTSTTLIAPMGRAVGAQLRGLEMFADFVM